MPIKNVSPIIYIITCIAALSGLLFGYDTGIIVSAVQIINKQFHLTILQHELIISAILFGAMFGALISGKLSDLYGCRRLLLWTSALFFAGSFILGLAPNIFTIILGRILLGLAIGAASYTAPLYIAEISPKKIRGALVIVNTVMITAGIVAAYLVGLILANFNAWRWMLLSGIIPAVLLGLGLLFLPESPRWLAKKGFVTLAKKTLLKMYSSSDTQKELTEIQDNILKEKDSNWRKLLSKENRKLLITGIGLAAIQQISGINTILYYGPTILKTAHILTLQNQLIATFCIGLVNLLFTIAAMFIVDRFGRRLILLLGLSVMAMCLFILSIAFYINIETQWVILFALMAFVASYALSIGCLFWLIISEIFPLHFRGFAMSLCATSNWLMNLIVSLSFLTLLSTIGPIILFLIYALITVLSWVFVYYRVPETSQKSLESIEYQLHQTKVE